MTKPRRIATTALAPVLSLSVLVGGVAITTSPATAAPRGQQLGSSSPVAVTAKGSKLSASQVKSVMGKSQTVQGTNRFTSGGFKGYASSYNWNPLSTRVQLWQTAAGRSSSNAALPADLKSTKKHLKVVSYNYNKKTKQGQLTGWFKQTRVIEDATGQKIKVTIYIALSEIGQGKTAVQAATLQVQYPGTKVSTKSLTQKANNAANILAKRYKI